MIRVIKHCVKALLYGIAGGSVVIVIIFVLFLESRPELKVWHEVTLDAEFTANRPAESFEAYLAMEDQLFAQLQERVYARIEPEARRLINRYHPDSLSNPDRWSTNWNRTFEFSTDMPRAGVLLLHGMSDSPYSLRSLGQHLHNSGAWVIGLRLPGHGTAPSGLVRVQWEDMAAAVRLAALHLHEKVVDSPLFLVGYSNGGALAVNYALSMLEDSTLPSITGLVLISPSIEVTPVAALAKWQARLGRLLGLNKLAWNSILPEYDPFKYNSFAVNAGHQVYRITNDIQSRIEAIGAAGKLNRFPPILAFQSVVDATVSTRAVVDRLFRKLPANGHELVLFDINRISEIEHVLINDPGSVIETMFHDANLPFTLNLLTNASKDNLDVVARQKQPGNSMINEISIGLKWPGGLYSLSHIALPFSVNDSLYGKLKPSNSKRIYLGSTDLRGERGVLQISAEDMLRLRWNPFYPYMERRILEFVCLSSP